MRVKICGITSPSDAELAVRAGADAIGINLVAGPRQVDLSTADEVARSLPPMVTPVALVKLRDGRVGADERAWINARRIRSVQLYGQVTAGSIGRLVEESLCPILVVPVQSAEFADPVNTILGECLPSRPAAVLLDAYEAGKAGGTGASFHWTWVAAAREAGRLDGWPPILLAGGLRSENVVEAIRRTRPYGVDVSSGVESTPGKKDQAKMRAFVSAARSALPDEA